MRVIAGVARGRHLTAPAGRDTRPTSDRVKEALFSALQPRLRGARVADLYAGSGALGIEALSRGATAATFVERSRKAQRAIDENLARTGLAGAATVVPAEVRAALRAGLPGAPFGVVLLDPPYDLDTADLAEVLRLVAPTVEPGGLVVLELGRHAPVPRWPDTLTPGRVRRYGDTLLHEAHAPTLTGEPAGEPPGELADGLVGGSTGGPTGGEDGTASGTGPTASRST